MLYDPGLSDPARTRPGCGTGRLLRDPMAAAEIFVGDVRAHVEVARAMTLSERNVCGCCGRWGKKLARGVEANAQRLADSGHQKRER